MKVRFLALLASAPLTALASIGPLDQYDCHNDPRTDEYHCHGASNGAKENHFFIGGSLRTDSWLYDDGPSNTFGGLSVDAEYSLGPVAVHGGYGYTTHLSGTSDFNLAGWDIGLKLGKNLSQLGNHLYAEAGYYSQNFTQPGSDSSKTTLSGYQVGGGFMSIKQKYAVDLRVLYKDPTSVADMWADVDSTLSANTSYISTQLVVYLRF